MKKLITGFVLAGSLISPLVALADTNPIVGGADPNMMQQAWGLTGYQTPHVAAGAVITDQHGYSETCPLWYPKQALGACQNITGTNYYSTRMIAAATFLISYFGSKQAAAKATPTMASWINSIQ